jgi:hypothetical protein
MWKVQRLKVKKLRKGPGSENREVIKWDSGDFSAEAQGRGGR